MSATDYKKSKKQRYNIFLATDDLERLMQICKERNESKSAVIRKLITCTKFLHIIEQIELNNKLNIDLLYELTKCGINLNQIAYHLNIDVTKDDEAKSDFLKAFRDFTNFINDFKKRSENEMIKLTTNQTRKLTITKEKKEW
ncbi:plasmid mobilization relaxosome protein MobC [Campylobacter sp. faydin G-140]|uniref:plasmid mobilization relaxosome protein MobC n=1 Tax=Campylobacter anatolicus TaxID=2829105 RepID=UPI001B9F735E|nr:plasmid mobilization relaxosome protein MobC [Campylobacter anatolicus]MBR8466525.1 plasmid mobilization relaxosome protein MobC [Campylobacter anatolicus]